MQTENLVTKFREALCKVSDTAKDPYLSLLDNAVANVEENIEAIPELDSYKSKRQFFPHGAFQIVQCGCHGKHWPQPSL